MGVTLFEHEIQAGSGRSRELIPDHHPDAAGHCVEDGLPWPCPPATSSRVPGTKSAALYYWVIGLWLVLCVPSIVEVAPTIESAYHRHWWLAALDVVCAVFIGFFWLNGIKDFVYTAAYHLVFRFRSLNVPTIRPDAVLRNPSVVLVYCTYNDFTPDSLLRSRAQDYDCDTVILDDSTNAAYRAQIDVFAAHHGIRVIRRADNVGFKGGNLNNFLQANDWDFFVILDSDEVIPSGFVSRALDYFAAGRVRPDGELGVGIVQANHRATRNRNRFMRVFAIGVDSHWWCYQTVKERFGFTSLLGHGAMVSRAAYEAAGGFPPVVAEDICLSIESHSAGFDTVFAADIMCEEEFPVDYQAFKKRHGKWTQGNMEFVRTYSRRILSSHMRWFEKLDIIMFTYSLPLTAVFSLYVVINIVLFPLVSYHPTIPVWMLGPTVLFLLAPMANDASFYWRELGPVRTLRYLALSTLLYGSMFYVSLSSSIKAILHAAHFHVTPKEGTELTWTESVKHHRAELLFGIALLAVSIFTLDSPLPVVLLAVPAVSAVFLARIHHR